MRILVLAAVALAGCATWRPVDPQSSADLSHGVFVVTPDQALVVEVDAVDGAALRGQVTGGCRAEGRPLEPAALRPYDAPDTTCERLGWTPAGPGGQAEIPLSGIVESRVYDPNTATTLVVIGGTAVGLAALALLIVFASGATQTVVEGRPLRARRGDALADAVPRSDWAQPWETSTVAGADGAAWTRVALKEHASVAAFSRLSLQLVALGAPPELVRRALRSALQEIEHARLCFAIAGRDEGAAVGPGPLPAAVDAAPVDAETMARESLIDGCLGEGLAAALARAAADRAPDPDVATALRRLARDEEEHAALAWDVVTWCMPRSAPARLIAAVEAAPTPMRADLPHLEGVAIAALFEELRAQAVARLASLERGARGEPRRSVAAPHGWA